MTARARTIATLRDRLRHAVAAFGEVPLRDLERMTNEIAGWQAQLPPRAGHGITQALRQVLDAAVRWNTCAETRRSSRVATRSRLRERCARSRSRSLMRLPRSCRLTTRCCRRSPELRDYAPRSGRRSNARTSTAPRGSLRSAAPSRPGRSSSWRRPAIAADRSHCRLGRSKHSTDCRRVWTPACCGRRRRAGC